MVRSYCEPHYQGGQLIFSVNDTVMNLITENIQKEQDTSICYWVDLSRYNCFQFFITFETYNDFRVELR